MSCELVTQTNEEHLMVFVIAKHSFGWFSDMVHWSECCLLSWLNVRAINWLYDWKGPKRQSVLTQKKSRTLFLINFTWHILSLFKKKLLCPWGLMCKMHKHVLSHCESLNILESFILTPNESVWNKGVSFYLYRAFIILHPTTDLCHGNTVSLLHCWFQSGPEGLVS